MREWMQSVIAKKERLAMPIMTHPGIELIEKTVCDAVTDGNIHYQAIKALDEKYPSAACTIIMDLTVEAEAFGASVDFPKDEIPNVIGRLVSDEDEVMALQIPGMDQARIPQYLLANKLAAENIVGKPVFGGAIGPFSLAGRLFDMSEIMMACYAEPEIALPLLEKCSEFLKNYCIALKEQGVNGVVIAEPAAGLLSNEGCSEFSSQFIKPIVDAVQDDYFMVMLHNCGNTGHCTEAMVETGAMAYHFGNKIDMVKALQDCRPNVLALGNLDPVTVFQSGTPEEVYQQTRALLKATSAFSNFILSSGCDMPPHTSHANIEAFYKALEDYNNQL